MSQLTGFKRPATASLTNPTLGKKLAKLESAAGPAVDTKKQGKSKLARKQTEVIAKAYGSEESSDSDASSVSKAEIRLADKKDKRHRRKRHHRRKSASETAPKKKSKKFVVKVRQNVESIHSDSSDDKKTNKKSKKSLAKSETVKRKKKKDKKKNKNRKRDKKTSRKKAKPTKKKASSSSSASSSAASSASSAPSSPNSRTVATEACPYEHSDAEADAADPGPDCPPLRPIGDYLDDRAEMLHQMFSAARGSQLRALVPDEFQRLTLTQLRDRCLPLLQGMSAKRIRRILAGDDPAMISSSDTDESAGEETHDADAKPDTVHVSASSRASTPIAIVDSTTTDDHAEVKPVAVEPALYPEDKALNEVGSAISDPESQMAVSKETEASSPDSRSEAVASVKTDTEASADSESEVAGSVEVAETAKFDSESEASVSIEADATVEAEAAPELREDTNSIQYEHGEALTPAEVEADSVILNEVVDLSDVEEEPAPTPARPQPSLDGKSRRQLEIIELEMRARAIQAMINAQEKAGSMHL